MNNQDIVPPEAHGTHQNSGSNQPCTVRTRLIFFRTPNNSRKYIVFNMLINHNLNHDGSHAVYHVSHACYATMIYRWSEFGFGHQKPAQRPKGGQNCFILAGSTMQHRDKLLNLPLIHTSMYQV